MANFRPTAHLNDTLALTSHRISELWPCRSVKQPSPRSGKPGLYICTAIPSLPAKPLCSPVGTHLHRHR
jgi:hypothetical protein